MLNLFYFDSKQDKKSFFQWNKRVDFFTKYCTPEKKGGNYKYNVKRKTSKFFEKKGQTLKIIFKQVVSRVSNNLFQWKEYMSSWLNIVHLKKFIRPI